MKSQNHISLLWKKLVALAAVFCAAMLLYSQPASLSPTETKAAALSLVTIVFWATGVLSEYLTALLFFLTAMLFSITSAGVIFSGFASAALWLVFAGLVLGIAISSTGLGTRVAVLVANRLRGSYRNVIGGLVMAGVLFSFLMPSAMGRVVLLTPIAISIASSYGFEKNSRGRTGILLAVILGTFIPAFGVLPANVPNMILAGMAETQFNISILYGPYLLLHFPILTLAKALLITELILFLFPDTLIAEKQSVSAPAKPATRDEKILGAVLAVMLCLWMTDFIHHIAAAWTALAGAVFLMLPGINIVTKKQFNQKINWPSIFFIAGILGLGAMINQSGLGHKLASCIIAHLPLGPNHDFLNYISISFATAATGLATTLPGVPAVFTPLADSIAQTTNLSMPVIFMLQVLGFSTVILPYQAPPIIIGMQLGEEKISSAARICLLLALITICFLLPVNFLWWKLTGWF